MKYSRLVSILFALCVCAWSAAGAQVNISEPNALRVCLYPGFAPFAEKNPDGVWNGWDVRYLQSFAATINKTFIPVEIASFTDIWMGPVRGLCDVAATGISDLPERRIQTGSRAVWTTHYYQVVRAFLVKESDQGLLKNQDSMRGKTVIVTENSTAHLDLVNRLGPEQINGVKIEFTTNEQAAALRVKNGVGQDTVFAYGGGLGSLQYLATKLGALAVVWPHCYMTSKLNEQAEPFSFVVSAEAPDLLEKLNTFIRLKNTPYPGGTGPELKCPPN